ncbi:thioesterase II family protein [Paenibacillus sp. NPDC057967]|uniref:thioesterase II family protein n=1 Tax=Paenibacillus sp. NPDC057967 TaxID=3346293 RepID=UPI0036D76F7D
MMVTLICLPYAGGSAQVYKRWTGKLHPSVRLVPVELSGRGSRMGQPFYRNVAEAVQDVLPLVREAALGGGSYALFGHSMGSLLAYELLHALREENRPLPVAAFLSGRGAPHCEHEQRRRIHELPDDAFLEEVKGLGGMPAELFQHRELLELFMPILRADFKLVGEYEAQPRKPLPLRLTILSGKTDSTVKGSLSDWEPYAAGGCDRFLFEGGHFFVHEQEKDVVALLNKTLTQVPALL